MEHLPMPTTNPRVNVTFGIDDFEHVRHYAETTKTSLSQAVAKLTLQALEEYEDMKLGETCVQRMKDKKPRVPYSREMFKKAWEEANKEKD